MKNFLGDLGGTVVILGIVVGVLYWLLRDNITKHPEDWS